MANCAVCDAELPPEQKTCQLCGSTVEVSLASEAATAATAPLRSSLSLPFPSLELSSPTSSSSVDQRQCPTCGRRFGSEHQDEFCPCGTELQKRETSVGASTSDLTDTSAIPVSPAPSSPSAPVGATRPPAGTICLVVYSDTKPRLPVRYVPVAKDVFSIGREDAIRGDFPDLDLGPVVGDALAKKVSRRHAEVLRARGTQTFVLRALPGNTGTQVGKVLAVPGQEYPLTDGVPIVLGGVVWMKFETIK